MKTLKDFLLKDYITSPILPGSHTNHFISVVVYTWAGERLFLESVSIFNASSKCIYNFEPDLSFRVALCLRKPNNDVVFSTNLEDYLLEPPTPAAKVLYGKK